MGSLNEKLDYLNETKQLIRSSLVQRGQTVDDSTPFRDYASKILNIETQSDFIDNRTVINDFTYQNDGYYKDIPNPDDYKVNTTVLCIGNLYSAENVLEQTAFVIYQIMSVSDGNAHCKVVDILDEYNVGDIKLFETVEEMQADTTAKEGDLAVVYKSEIQNITADMEITSITFPETVTLPTAFTGNARCRLRAVDDSVMFDGNCQLSQTSFRFDSWSESGMIRVNYTSTDGITYTRTRFQGGSGDLTNPVEIPACKVYNPEEWNDNLGYFMQIGGMNFNGLYKYGKYTVDGYISIPLINDDYTITSTPSKSVTINNSYSNSFNKQDLIDICKEIEASVSSNSSNSVSLFMKDNKLYALGYVRTYNGNIYLNSLHNEIGEDNTILSNVLVNGNGTSSNTENEPNFEVKIWEIDMSNKSYSLNTSIQYEISYIKSISSSGTIFYSTRVTFAEPFDTMCFSQIYSRIDFPYMWKHVSGGDFDQYHITCDLTYHKSEYQIAPSQLTLNNPNQLLPDITAYGKNGVITGDNSIYDNIGYASLFDNLSGINLDYVGYKYTYMDDTILNTKTPLVMTSGSKSIVRCYQTPCEISGDYTNAICNSDTMLMLKSIGTDNTFAIILYNIYDNTEKEITTVKLENVNYNNEVSIQVNENLGYLVTADLTDNTINVFELKDNKVTKVGSYASGVTNKYYYITLAYCNNKLYIMHRVDVSATNSATLHINKYDNNTITKIKEVSTRSGNSIMVTSGDYVYCMNLLRVGSSSEHHTIAVINTNDDSTNIYTANITEHMYGERVGSNGEIQIATSNTGNIYAISKLRSNTNYTLCKMTPTGISVVGTYPYSFKGIEGIYNEDTTTVTVPYGLSVGSNVNISTGDTYYTKGHYTYLGDMQKGIQYNFGSTPLIPTVSSGGMSIFSYQSRKTILCNTFVTDTRHSVSDRTYKKCILKIYTNVDFKETTNYKNPILRASDTTVIQFGVADYSGTITPTEYNVALDTATQIKGE